MNQENRKTQLTNWEIVSVNPNDKKWDWIDLFCFWGVNLQSIIGFSLITSLYLVYELNFVVVLAGSLIASILIYIFVNLIGSPAQKHGIPFPVFLRLSMGIEGARYVSIIRGSVGIFMFGVQSYFISKSFGYLIRILLFSLDKTLLDQDIFLIFFFNLNIIDWISFLFAILLQIFLFSRSHSYNKLFINFSASIIYLGMISILILIFSENSKYILDSFRDIIVFDNFFNKNNVGPILAVTGTIFAYFSIIIVNFGDYSRYVKNEKELKKGNLSLILNLLIFSLFSVFIVIGSDIILNMNLENMERILTSPTDIIGKFDNIPLTVVVLFFILIASASTNLIANYIPAQNSLLNFKPNKLNLKSSAFLIGFIGFFIGISWVPFFSQIGILSFLDTLSAFFGPIFAIMVVDYYLIKNKNVINKDIFLNTSDGKYFFSNGWHLKAIYSMFIGFIFAASTIWNIELRFLQSYSWILGAAMASLTYYLLAKK